MFHTLSTVVSGIELLTEITAAGVLLMALDRLAAAIRWTYRAGRLAGAAWFRWGQPALLVTADFISWLISEIDWEEAKQTLIAFVALVIATAALIRDRWTAWHDVTEPTTAAVPLPVAVSPLGVIAQELAEQRVSDLRKAARAAGMSHLGRRGRKAELIAALAAA